eukprot:134631_1
MLFRFAKFAVLLLLCSVLARASEDNQDETTQSCDICSDEKTSDEMVWMSCCLKMYCRDCVEKWEKETEGGPPSCPNCGKPLGNYQRLDLWICDNLHLNPMSAEKCLLGDSCGSAKKSTSDLNLREIFPKCPKKDCMLHMIPRPVSVKHCSGPEHTEGDGTAEFSFWCPNPAHKSEVVPDHKSEVVEMCQQCASSAYKTVKELRACNKKVNIEPQAQPNNGVSDSSGQNSPIESKITHNSGGDNPSGYEMKATPKNIGRSPESIGRSPESIGSPLTTRRASRELGGPPRIAQTFSNRIRILSIFSAKMPNSSELRSLQFLFWLWLSCFPSSVDIHRKRQSWPLSRPSLSSPLSRLRL